MTNQARKEAQYASRQMGKNIKHIRLSQQMGVPTIARQLNIPMWVLSNVESGKYIHIKVRLLSKLAIGYKVDLAIFFENT